jgi:hypothetical protein
MYKHGVIVGKSPCLNLNLGRKIKISFPRVNSKLFLSSKYEISSFIGDCFLDKPLEHTRIHDKLLTFNLASRDALGSDLEHADWHPYKLQLKYRRELNIKHFSLLVCQLGRVTRAQKQLPERMP